MSRSRSPAELGAQSWDETTCLDGRGLGLDSLERLSASAALSEFFHLHEYGAEDYLLSLPTVGEWCDLVEQSLSATGTHLTFRTSGTGGTPKRCTHALADLMIEVDAWRDMLGEISQVVSVVPSHHIYGTIFTALLPDYIKVDCVNARFGGANIVSRSGPRSLVVGNPPMWTYLARSLDNFPVEMTGISSTAALPAGLAQQLSDGGLSRLIEVYGSSETGGIGYRLDPSAPFALLDHWRREGDGDLSRSMAGHERVAHTMMDDAAWDDDTHFRLAGRRDGAVQVGGHNVFLDHVRQRLIEHAEVADAYVRFEPTTGRLKAFVVPGNAISRKDIFIDQLDAWCSLTLKDAERPRIFSIGAALPRTAMGKLSDW